MSNTPFETILCPVDFSECSAEALREGAQLAVLGGAKLVLLHAVHLEVPAYMTEGSAVHIRRELSQARDEAAHHLKDWAAPHLPAGMEFETVIDDRAPVEAIKAAAAKLPKPWIVMGTHGRTGLQKLLIGSVTERTLREAHTPIVTIPPRQAS